jgi:hypothetical protein
MHDRRSCAVAGRAPDFDYDGATHPNVRLPGGTVARAKRTSVRAEARAEARRRYRASLAQADAGEITDEEVPPEPERPARPAARPAAATPTAAPARPSMTKAFRAAFRPLDLRGDIATIPAIVRHRSFLLPTILSGLSVALIPLVPLAFLTLAFTLYQYFSWTTPMGASFLAGFLAPRASWLVGLMVGLASVVFQVLAFNGPFLGIFPEEAQAQVINEALFVGLPSAALFAAAAAWYKRFLALANPNRARLAAQQDARRSSARTPRRNDGRRPALARRR